MYYIFFEKIKQFSFRKNKTKFAKVTIKTLIIFVYLKNNLKFIWFTLI